MATLLDRLKERTSTVRQASRGQPYNYPPLWYCRSDGGIVKLAGDPQNRAYYEDKGYTVLRPEEAREWEQDVRPATLEEQREKASLLSTIRRIGSKHPGVEIADDLDDFTTPELTEFLQELGTATGAPTKVMTRRHKPAEVREPDDDGLAVHSGAELQEAITRSQRGRR